jgi:pyruvate dehydrogenase E1 component alpha subunit
MSARACMAELFGKDTGCSKGLGGSMHFFDVERILGGYGIVGGHVALAAAYGLQGQVPAATRVTVCFLGEGAVSIGGFTRRCRSRALWRCRWSPSCENNEYSMGTPLSRTLPGARHQQKAAGLRHGFGPLRGPRRDGGRATASARPSNAPVRSRGRRSSRS